MDQDDVIGGGPRLDRQEHRVPVDVSGRPLIPSRVPETRPTPLQDVFIYLSIGVLVCGVIAIMALDFGARLSDPVVRFPIAIGGGLLVAVTLDAIVRIWRSAFAWLPVDRGRGWFRFVWVTLLVVALVGTIAAMWLTLTA